jgi:DNA-binding response OmpR family regulator
LLKLIDHPHVVMNRDELLSELVEGVEAFFDENTLSVYIRRLREKIEDNVKEPEYIITQRGFGYKWNKDVIRE